MRVVIMRRVGEGIQEIDAAVVIVKDNLGNPVQVACEVIPGVIELEDVRKTAEFNRILLALGLRDTVICEQALIDKETGRLIRS